VESSTPAVSTRWIYDANHAADAEYATMYSTFDTPIDAPADKQCGRAVLAEMHVSETSDSSDFPLECSNLPTEPTKKERALEFLFFDLFSCLGNDRGAPSPPPAM
jgi:hypothetical protein